MSEEQTGQSGFEKLWAPWRMKYIDGIDTGEEVGCIFCDLPDTDADAERFILHRGKNCFIMMNLFPYNNGHLMIIPYLHTASLDDLSADTRLELMDLTALVVRVMKGIMRPDGCNIGMNLGRSAGAGIADHLHLHVVPRWNGDTNFMPVVGGTKVISESLEDTYAKLARGIAEALAADK